jgi:hypothetical protein
MGYYHGKSNGGHAKGHVRDTFLEAIEAFWKWKGRGPIPTVQFEGGEISIADAAGMLWNCSDALPSEYSALFDERPGSYGAAARILRRATA